ncbi:MAG: 50S ribosomal protein L10 [Candidatus Bathyarchaeia archaeon]
MSQVSQEKIEIVEETEKLIDSYEIIAVADLYKVGSNMLQDIRKQLRDEMAMRCIKNTMMRISLDKASVEGGEAFMDAIPGQNLYLFTDGNPFKLAMRLDRSKVRVFAKPGDVALEDIVIPSGNTGLAPGPIISKFGALGIRTRIESGNIWVNEDTVVAEEGEEIGEDLADLLQRMGIKATEMGLSIKAVYEDGVIIPGKELLLDIEEYMENLSKAHSGAFSLALNASYVTPETITSLLIMARQKAKGVALESGYLTRDTVKELIATVSSQAKSLAVKVGQVQAAQRS